MNLNSKKLRQNNLQNTVKNMGSVVNLDEYKSIGAPKFKVGDLVRISKYKKNFAKGYTTNWSEEVFLIKKVKNTTPWIYVSSGLNSEDIAGTFNEKDLQKTNQTKFTIEKVIRRKGYRLYVKWKGYDNSFNSWINMKDSIKKCLYFLDTY